MQPIPIPKGLRGLQASPKQFEGLKNLVYSAQDTDYLMIRPSVKNLLNLGGICRGLGIFRNDVTGDEELYGVYGSAGQ